MPSLILRQFLGQELRSDKAAWLGILGQNLFPQSALDGCIFFLLPVSSPYIHSAKVYSAMMSFLRQASRLTVLRRRRFRFQLKNRPKKDSRHQSHHLPHGPAYHPGDIVRETGIYEIVHDKEHRQAHEAVMLSGDTFPACDTCLDRVRFRLVRTAPYIFQDEDFEEQQR